jgi:hypothetical protein
LETAYSVLTLFVGWFMERQFETADSASVKFSDR